MSLRSLMVRPLTWLAQANMVQVFVFAISPILVILFLAVLLRNPSVEQVPLGAPFIVEVKRECKAAPGPCMTCLPDADGTMNCAAVTFGTCPGTQMMRETQQEMTITRRRGEPKAETVTLKAKALSECEG